MAVKSSSFAKRALSAIILAPVIVMLIVAGGWAYWGLVAAAAGISLYELIQMEKLQPQTFLRNVMLEIVYLAVSAGAFLKLRLGYEDGLFLMLAVMLMVWASDTGAYAAGKSIGGPKMCPRLSPNKTWAGLAGGMIASAITLIIFDMVRDITPAHAIVVLMTGLAMGAVGQAGDLLISSIKRRVGVKDTGHLIPGHGGILDRIDALLLVVPAFLLAHFLWI